MGLFLTAVPFIYIAIGVFYGPVAVIVRSINFLKFRKNDDGSRPEQLTVEGSPSVDQYGRTRTTHEYDVYKGLSTGQVFGNLSATAVIIIALLGVALLLGFEDTFFFAALAALIVPAFAFSFDLASIWGKRRTKAENQALVDGITGVRVRYVILALSWAIGIVGSYWLAIWFFIIGGPSSLF